MLAPPQVDPAARRGVPGWRRLLTLESPGQHVVVRLGGAQEELLIDAAGMIEVVLETDLPPGHDRGRDRRGRPPPRPCPCARHLASGTRRPGLRHRRPAWITGLSHPLRAAWRTLAKSGSSRRSVPGMARLLRRVVEGRDHAPVIYLSNGPWNLAGPVSRFLEREDFPPDRC